MEMKAIAFFGTRMKSSVRMKPNWPAGIEKS